LNFNKKKTFCLAKDKTVREKIPEFFQEVDKEKLMTQYPNLTILQGKSVDMLIGKIRDKTVEVGQFRILSRRIIRLIIEEALAVECDEEVIKESPLGYYKTKFSSRKNEDYIAVSILRSGNSMVDEIMQIMPNIYIGKILVQRDENTLKPVFFFEKLQKHLEEKRVFLLDPMLGTGGSASAAIDILLKKGAKEENILFLNLVSCPEGLEVLFKKYPKIKIVTAKVDPLLLPNGYLAPGMGDFGDRFYGTVEE